MAENSVQVLLRLDLDEPDEAELAGILRQLASKGRINSVAKNILLVYRKAALLNPAINKEIAASIAAGEGSARGSLTTKVEPSVVVLAQQEPISIDFTQI
jgi:hypothetical protein